MIFLCYLIVVLPVYFGWKAISVSFVNDEFSKEECVGFGFVFFFISSILGIWFISFANCIN